MISWQVAIIHECGELRMQIDCRKSSVLTSQRPACQRLAVENTSTSWRFGTRAYTETIKRHQAAANERGISSFLWLDHQVFFRMF